MSDKKPIFATSRIGDPAESRLRERGYELEVFQGPEAPPKTLIIEKVKSGIDALITTLRDPRVRLEPRTIPRARVTTRLSIHGLFLRFDDFWLQKYASPRNAVRTVLVSIT